MIDSPIATAQTLRLSAVCAHSQLAWHNTKSSQEARTHGDPALLWAWPGPMDSPASSSYRPIGRRGPQFPNSRQGHSFIWRPIHGGLGIILSGPSLGINFPCETAPGAALPWQQSGSGHANPTTMRRWRLMDDGAVEFSWTAIYLLGKWLCKTFIASREHQQYVMEWSFYNFIV